MKQLSDLDEQQILALAISLEEEHSRIYQDYAADLRDQYPASAKVFGEMADEESDHRRMLIDLYREKFGEHIPLIRRHDVRGFVKHTPHWMVRPLGLGAVRRQAEEIEEETRKFYERALEHSSDASIRKLLGDLAEAEREHENLALQLGDQHLTPGAESEEEIKKRMRGLGYIS